MVYQFNYIKAHLLVFLATFLVAISFIVSEKIVGVVDPISLTLFRFIISFVALLPFILIIKKYRVKIKNSLFKGLKISFFYSLFFVFLFKALETTTSLNTSTLFTLVPFSTALISYFVFKDKLSAYKNFIYLIGVLGTIIVILNGNSGKVILFNQGDLLFLVGVIFMSLYSVSTKYFHDSKNDEVLVLTLSTLLGGIIWMTLTIVILDIPLMWEKIEYQYVTHIIYLSLGATLLTVFLYQQGTVILGPNKVMAYTYLNPAIVTLILFAVENKEINLLTLFGILLSSFATLIILKGANYDQSSLSMENQKKKIF